MFDHHNRCCHEYTAPVPEQFPFHQEGLRTVSPQAHEHFAGGATVKPALHERLPRPASAAGVHPPTTTTTHRLRALLFRPPPPTSPLRLREAGLAASGASELSSPPPRVFNIIFQGFANLPVLRKNQPATPFCSFFPVTTQFGKLLITLLLLDTMCPWHLIQRYNINRKDC